MMTQWWKWIIYNICKYASIWYNEER